MQPLLSLAKQICLCHVYEPRIHASAATKTLKTNTAKLAIYIYIYKGVRLCISYSIAFAARVCLPCIWRSVVCVNLSFGQSLPVSSSVVLASLLLVVLSLLHGGGSGPRLHVDNAVVTQTNLIRN